jgi:hypothetical protein
MTNKEATLDKAGTMHYLSQLYYGFDPQDRPFITNQLEDELTAQHVAESWNEAKECFDAILAKRDRSKPVSEQYREADFDYMYFSELYSKLGDFHDMLFIKSLEIQFHPDTLADFKQKANESLQESVNKILNMLKSL